MINYNIENPMNAFLNSAGGLQQLQSNQIAIDNAMMKRQAEQEAAQKQADLMNQFSQLDFSNQDQLQQFIQQNPEMLEQVKRVSSFGDSAKNKQALEAATQFDRALNSGNPELIESTINSIAPIIDNNGDPTFTSDTVRQMAQTPQGINQLKLMSQGYIAELGGKDYLSQTSLTPQQQATNDLNERKFKFDQQYKNQTLANTQAYRSKMLSIQQSKAKNAQPKFVKTVKDNDGNVIKLYSDGSERPLQQNEKIKDDSMRGGMTPKQADNIISAAPEFSRKNAGFASRLRDSIDGNNALVETGKVTPERAAAISKALGDGNASNLVLSPEDQQYMVNAKDALMAILRPETGAAITPDEMQEYAKIYLPQVGDSEATIKLKNKKLENQFKSLRATAGKTYEALRVAGGYNEENQNENNNVNETFTSSDGLQIKVIQ